MSDAWTIRPLEWRDSEIESTANTVFGEWQIVQMASGRWWFGTIISTYEREEAKRAVEAYYVAKLQSALAPATDRSVMEECRKALRLVESMFKRQAACPVSSEHLGDDEHEAWTATTASLALIAARSL